MSALEVLSNPPKDPIENAIYRDRLVIACNKDPQLASDVLGLCQNDILWYFSSMVWTFDPRKPSSALPFILWSYQEEMIARLQENYKAGRDLLIEKSRDMGVTWVILGWLLWHWRFERGFQAIIGSRVETLIDQRGDMSTHFERFRWMIRHLPTWWVPAGFDLQKHSPYMQLINPEGSAGIIGQAVTDDFSRQSRVNVAWVDEFAFCESAENAWRAMADSAPMRLVVSSPDGLGNKFASLRRSATIQVETLHWAKHPEKSRGLTCAEHGDSTLACKHPRCKLTSPWYEGEKMRRTPQEIASELDIDYLSSGSPYFPLDALEKQKPQEPKQRGIFVELDHGIEWRPMPDGIWAMWEVPPELFKPKTMMNWRYPDPIWQYCIGADPSEGIGQDFSAAVVRSARDRSLVALLRAQLPPDEFAFELEKAGKFFNFARILCEREGPGHAVNLDLFKRYGNLYYETLADRSDAVQTKRFGFSTNPRTRPIILSQMSEEIRTSAVQLKDLRLIEECRTFVVKENGKAEADEGYHDDLVMAWAICGFGLQTTPKVIQKRRPRYELERPSRTSLV